MQLWSGAHSGAGRRSNGTSRKPVFVAIGWVDWLRVCESAKPAFRGANAIIFASGNSQQISWAVLQATARGVHSAVRQVPAVRIVPTRRGVAQPGRAPGSGPGGRRFKSSLPDQSSPLQLSRPPAWQATMPRARLSSTKTPSTLARFIAHCSRPTRAASTFAHCRISRHCFRRQLAERQEPPGSSLQHWFSPVPRGYHFPPALAGRSLRCGALALPRIHARTFYRIRPGN